MAAKITTTAVKARIAPSFHLPEPHVYKGMTGRTSQMGGSDKTVMWVFGYGSLIWNPDFLVAETRVARLQGWHRSFCMRSIHHRGTVADPGLVLALDREACAHCDGVAFRVQPGAEAATLAALRERELISSAYLEDWLEVDLLGGGQVTTLAYVIDPDHDQYCGGLPLEEQAQIIAQAVGGRGRNCDYLFNTADHLASLGIEDADLAWLANRVRNLRTDCR